MKTRECQRHVRDFHSEKITLRSSCLIFPQTVLPSSSPVHCRTTSRALVNWKPENECWLNKIIHQQRTATTSRAARLSIRLHIWENNFLQLLCMSRCIHMLSQCSVLRPELCGECFSLVFQFQAKARSDMAREEHWKTFTTARLTFNESSESERRRSRKKRVSQHSIM